MTPPFVIAGVQPNLLLTLDNSSSMFDPTYIDEASDSYYCYDDTYNNTRSYAGYFERSLWYTFIPAQNKFVVTTPPGTCNNQTSYVCVDITTTSLPHVLNQFKATGNFLNWLSASKFDVQKMILTGGKYHSGVQALIGESRGCFGRRFIKELPVANFKATFAVRGPMPMHCSTTTATACTADADCPLLETCIEDILSVSEGGLTEIEILSGNFNADICQEAIEEALYGSLGQLKKKIDACLDFDEGGGNIAYGQQDTIDQNASFNQSVQACWNGSPQNWGHYQSLQNACDKIYDANGTMGMPPTMSTDPHDIPLTARASVCSYAYIGKCWYDNTYSWPGDDQCYQDQMDLFCNSFEFPEVIDPSATPTDTQQHGNIPGMLWHTAVESQLGKPVAVYPVRVDQSGPPTGLIHEFTNLIRFGLMAFNYLGSKTECAAFPAYNEQRIGFACEDIGATDKDAAQVLAPIGSDVLTIVDTINGLRGETWTPYAEGFYDAIAYFTQNTNTSSPLPHRLNTTDFDTSVNPIQYRCQKNNILMVSDGKSTTDQNRTVNDFIANNSAYREGDTQYTSGAVAANSTVVPTYFGSKNLDDLAWYAHHKNIFNPAAPILEEKETITTHVVYTGVPCLNKNAFGECTTVDEAVPEKLMQETAENGGGTYQRAEDPEDLYTALREAFITIAGRAASGTAASVLATGEGSGANLVQALFYPEINIGGTKLSWTGTLKNLWYYIDPLLSSSSIREDTVTDKTLRLTDDRIIDFFFDPSDKSTKADLYADSDGDGVKDTPGSPAQTVYFENVKSLWEGGAQLFATNAAARDVYTYNGTSSLKFEIANDSLLQTLLQTPGTPSARRLISYILGTDYNTPFCSVTVTQACTIDSDCPAGEACIRFRNRTATIDGVTNTVKLGDIVDSTPKIVSRVPLNLYHKTYLDKSYEEFTETHEYQNKGMVIVGANDGMLHAFEFGRLELFEEKSKKAQLYASDLDGNSLVLGQEKWAYIPKNALPYLQYLAKPGYCHLYYVDLTPYVFDASIGTTGCGSNYWECDKTKDTWRTIVIGGMRLGGACKSAADTNADGVADACLKDMNFDGVINNADCVPLPSATDSNGYSSYFALDITDPDSPQVLWEFTDPQLGYAVNGPAVVRIAAKQTGGSPDHNKNGKWFVVFGSGPTGPVDAATHQFKGYSDQNMRLFILDLATGNPLKTINTGVENAFAGHMVGGMIDFDQNDPSSNGFYQDDAVYFGFTKAENNPPLASTKWNTGGVYRLVTKESLDPDDWDLSKVIDTGPVPSAVTKLQDFKNNTVFIYWGTGRYFFKIGSNIDDANNSRALYGVKEPCYSSSGFDSSCTSTVNWMSLCDATAAGCSDNDGWRITLDAADATFKAERNVTDPLATPIGAVFFTTTKPSSDVCEYGGATHLWAVYHKTGGAVSSNILRGKALLQVSTGSIEEVTLDTAFTERGGRRTSAFQGVPPAGAPPGILVPPEPTDKILHIREQ